eukprot:Platyproteum_vivax@DN6823_c0_g1_i1.p1
MTLEILYVEASKLYEIDVNSGAPTFSGRNWTLSCGASRFPFGLPPLTTCRSSADDGVEYADLPTENAEELIDAIRTILSMITQCDRSPLDAASSTKYDALDVPLISVADYFQRLVEYFECSPGCFLLALIFMDRLALNSNNFTVDNLNAHRLLATASMLAAKVYDDRFLLNSWYAEVGGVTVKELNFMEVNFLSDIGSYMLVTPRQYLDYRHAVVSLSNIIKSAQSCLPTVLVPQSSLAVATPLRPPPPIGISARTPWQPRTKIADDEEMSPMGKKVAAPDGGTPSTNLTNSKHDTIFPTRDPTQHSISIPKLGKEQSIGTRSSVASKVSSFGGQTVPAVGRVSQNGQLSPGWNCGNCAVCVSNLITSTCLLVNRAPKLWHQSKEVVHCIIIKK